MVKLLFEEESYQIIGRCMEVHNNLGPGFLEIVYKDALEYEFRECSIRYDRERKYDVKYKQIILPHFFYADFVICDKIILEAKAVSAFSREHTALCLNYLKVSGLKLALLVNFGNTKLMYRRIVF